MSKRKKSSRSNVGKSIGHPSLSSVLLSLLSLVTSIVTNLLSLLTCSLDWFKMMSLENEVLSKKEARVKNKRSKLMAEYNLVCKTDEPTNKKVKFDDNEKKGLNEEEFKKLKKELAERKRMLLQLPRFNLNSTCGIQSSIHDTDYSTRTPLLFSDIQHLLTYAYGGNELVLPPSRWCTLQKPNRLAQIIVLVVDGLGLNEFIHNEEHFPLTMDIFGSQKDTNNRAIIEFLSPHWYGMRLESELMSWSVINKKDLPDNPQGFDQVLKQLSTVFPIDLENVQEQTPPKEDTFPRNSLILSLAKLIQESYPLPIPANSTTREVKHFVPSCDKYNPVGLGSKMYSIDCEMCEAENNNQALTKIAIVDEGLNVVYETFVKPKERIIDYRTRWSGVTKEMIDPVCTTVEDVQSRVREIVAQAPDCIFIGQSLNCDLQAIRMTHPYVIDTSVIFNLTGVEGRKSKLKHLCWNLMNEDIQRTGPQILGHCPVEDARAAMKLVLMKLAKGFSFGNELKNVNQNNTVISFDPVLIKTSLKQKKLDKNVLVISQEEMAESETKGSDKYNIKYMLAPSNRQTVKALKENCFEHFMSIGFYKIKKEVLEADTPRCISKFDKRIDKIYSHMLSNSLLLLVCSRQDNSESRESRNNGVCFIKIKSSEVQRRARLDN
ncbi:unnamed protein product [Orchesella dallaii]|uniref:Exonuclease domain-containing protein n=1 Tax=Orchesella dallaii TaxID=48710 RepID=A0ABP1RAI4_9HEXA